MGWPREGHRVRHRHELQGGAVRHQAIEDGHQAFLEDERAAAVAGSVEHLCLATEDGKHAVMACSSGEKLRIPDGRWRLIQYQVLRKDGEGDLWALSAGSTKATPVLAIGEGTRLPFGEPYTATAFVPGYVYQQFAMTGRLEQAWIEFYLRGASGEVVSDLTHVSGDRTKIPLAANRSDRAKEPTYTIVKTSGQVVAEGSFQYG